MASDSGSVFEATRDTVPSAQMKTMSSEMNVLRIHMETGSGWPKSNSMPVFAGMERLNIRPRECSAGSSASSTFHVVRAPSSTTCTA